MTAWLELLVGEGQVELDRAIIPSGVGASTS